MEDKCILMTGAIKSAQSSHLICSTLIYPNLEIIYDVIPLNMSPSIHHHRHAYQVTRGGENRSNAEIRLNGI